MATLSGPNRRTAITGPAVVTPGSRITASNGASSGHAPGRRTPLRRGSRLGVCRHRSVARYAVPVCVAARRRRRRATGRLFPDEGDALSSSAITSHHLTLFGRLPPRTFAAAPVLRGSRRSPPSGDGNYIMLGKQACQGAVSHELTALVCKTALYDARSNATGNPFFTEVTSSTFKPAWLLISLEHHELLPCGHRPRSRLVTADTTASSAESQRLSLPSYYPSGMLLEQHLFLLDASLSTMTVPVSLTSQLLPPPGPRDPAKS